MNRWIFLVCFLVCSVCFFCFCFVRWFCLIRPSKTHTHHLSFYFIRLFLTNYDFNLIIIIIWRFNCFKPSKNKRKSILIIIIYHLNVECCFWFMFVVFVFNYDNRYFVAVVFFPSINRWLIDYIFLIIFVLFLFCLNRSIKWLFINNNHNYNKSCTNTKFITWSISTIIVIGNGKFCLLQRTTIFDIENIRERILMFVLWGRGG